MPERSSKQVAPRTLHCDIAVLFRDAETAGGFIDRLQDATDLHGNGFAIRMGKLGERVVALGIAGKSTSLVAMADAIAFAHKPQLIVIGTFAVSLSDEITANSVILAERLAAQGLQEIELPPWSDVPLQRGLLWATHQLVSPPAEALAAIPADIYPAAAWCRDHGIALEIVAVVNRHAADVPPADVQQILNQPSVAGRVGAFLGAAWRRPSSVPDLWRQKETAWIAREKLGDAIVRIAVPNG